MIVLKSIIFLLAILSTLTFFLESIFKGLDTIQNKRRNTIKSVFPAAILWTIFYILTQS